MFLCYEFVHETQLVSFRTTKPHIAGEDKKGNMSTPKIQPHDLLSIHIALNSCVIFSAVPVRLSVTSELVLIHG